MTRTCFITRDELRALIKAAYMDGFDDGGHKGAQLPDTEAIAAEAEADWPNSVTHDNLEQDLKLGKWDFK